MESWQKGDSRAFEALVRHWEQPVARLLGRLVDQRDAIPDLCQEVFLRVYQGGPKYRENGSFAAWLYRIALNVAHDAGRRRWRSQPLASHDPEDWRDSAETVCQHREAADLVQLALRDLAEPLRLVLVLHHYEKLNFAEIARVTGTPASTLKSRFGAALTRLRVRLQELGLNPEETTS